MASRAQVRWRPSAQRRPCSRTYAWNHSRFTSGVRDGNRFRLSPDHTFSLGGAVRRRRRAGAAQLRAERDLSDRASSSTTTTTGRTCRPSPRGALVADTLQDEVQGGYALVNARLGYTFNERFTIEAFVSNLFDEDYIKDAGNTGNAAGLPTFIAGEPRFYGVQASVRF